MPFSVISSGRVFLLVILMQLLSVPAAECGGIRCSGRSGIRGIRNDCLRKGRAARY